MTCSSIRQVALERIRYEGLFAREIVYQVQESFDRFHDIILSNDSHWNLNDITVDDNAVIASETLLELLKFVNQLADLDITLAEELVLELNVKKKILQKMLDFFQEQSIHDDNPLCNYFCELYDSLSEISFRLKGCRSSIGLTDEDLSNRLPFIYPFQSINQITSVSSYSILISQVQDRQSAQEDVGFLMWPSAVILAHYIVSHPNITCGKNVIELGAGCGLAGIAAARYELGRAKSVTFTDFNEIVLRNLKRNILMNEVGVSCKVEKLDFYDQVGDGRGWFNGAGERCHLFDLAIAADIICRPSDAIAAAKTCYDVLKPDGIAIIICGDSNHRYGVEIFEEECRKINLHVRSEVLQSSKLRGILKKSLHTTAGYVDDMNLKLFLIKKENNCQCQLVG